VEELARIRDEEGYMAEVQSRRSSDLVLLEHNCPILAIAEKYGEACDVERRLFRNLLGTDVLVSHRVVAGDPVCRFLVRVPLNPP
jgi:DeoR family transcriptional regulator, suf operon transcriptional repressor